jgi:hypothetical protein
MQTYRLRLLHGDEIVSEEFFPASDLNNARLTTRTRVLTFRAAVNYEFTHELVAVET